MEEVCALNAELEQKVVERTERLAEREREHLQILEDSPLHVANRNGLEAGAEAGLVLLGVFEVGIGHHPLRAALEVDEVVPLLAEVGDHLHPGGAVADHPDAPALQRDRAVPAGGVHGRAGEAVQPGDVGQLGVVEHARRRDHEVDHGGVDVDATRTEPDPRELCEKR